MTKVWKIPDLFYYSVFKSQSIGVKPCDCKNSLHFAKCPQPKKPLYAESGDGCAASNIK